MSEAQRSQPTPFEIIELIDGRHVASNGKVNMMLMESDGRLFKRRGVKGISLGMSADSIVRQLNEFSGELLAHPELSNAEIVARLDAIRAAVRTSEPQRIEWAVAELGDVRVYVDGESVIVTRADLRP